MALYMRRGPPSRGKEVISINNLKKGTNRASAVHRINAVQALQGYHFRQEAPIAFRHCNATSSTVLEPYVEHERS